jgi:hypothetical protein
MSDRPCEVCTYQHQEFFCTAQEKAKEPGCPFKKIEKLEEQNLRLVRSQGDPDFGQICSYCGWESEASGASGVSWLALQEHIHHCKKHPVYLLRKKVEKLSNALNNCLYLLDDYQGNNAEMSMIKKAQGLLVGYR